MTDKRRGARKDNPDCPFYRKKYCGMPRIVGGRPVLCRDYMDQNCFPAKRSSRLGRMFGHGE